MKDFRASYGYRNPKQLWIGSRDIDLTNPGHLQQIENLIKDKKAALAILDVWGHMTPGVDENSAKEVGEVIIPLKFMARRLGCTILILDHSTKFQGGFSSLRGSSAKWGASDFLLRLSSGGGTGLLKLYRQHKDFGVGDPLLLRVSPPKSKVPKFQIVGSAKQQQTTQRQPKSRKQKTMDKILAAMDSGWMRRGEIQQRSGIPETTLKRYLNTAVRERTVKTKGDRRNRRYKKV